jgi:hypothetical protein
MGRTLLVFVAATACVAAFTLGLALFVCLRRRGWSLASPRDFPAIIAGVALFALLRRGARSLSEA